MWLPRIRGLPASGPCLPMARSAAGKRGRRLPHTPSGAGPARRSCGDCSGNGSGQREEGVPFITSFLAMARTLAGRLPSARSSESDTISRSGPMGEPPMQSESVASGKST